MKRGRLNLEVRVGSTCRDCGAELLWVTCGPMRVPLDTKVRPYRITSSVGTPTVEQMSTIPGMPHAGGVDHRAVCKPRPPRPVKRSDEEEGE